jgi:hypothetical protein
VKNVLEKTAAVFAILFLCASAAATQVGVVVEYPDGRIFSTCLAAEEDADGYALLEETGLGFNWSISELYGHGLCGIEDVGCSAEDCWCTDKYWGFYVKKGDGPWEYSAVGFDGGATCQEHYCAKDGDLVGLAYGAYGTKPAEKTFEEVCDIREEHETGEEAAGSEAALLLIVLVAALAAAPIFLAYATYPGEKT